MDKMKPLLRWVAVGIAAIAVVFAYVTPHHTDQSALPDASAPPLPAVGAADAASPPSSPTPGTLAVYVCGAIRKTGVYRLGQGARVVDAVDQAGGLSSDADAEAINLAEPLSDGMKIDVPKKGEHPEEAAARPNTAPRRHSPSRHTTGRSGSHKLQPGQSLNINTATESELMALPGVGPGLARRIVEYRSANGPFAAIDDLQNVSGVGPSKFAKMERYLRV